MLTTISDITFSLILPSRGRPEMLTDLLSNINAQTVERSAVEVLIGIDEDDTSTINVVRQHPEVKGVVGSRSFNLAAIQNELYRRSKGRFLFLLNDDVLLPYAWDVLALSKLNGKGWAYGQTSPAGVNETYQYSEFPILSRPAVDNLGWAMPEMFTNWGADAFVFKVYRDGECVVDLRELEVQHRRPNDETHKALAQHMNNDKINPDHVEFAMKLKHARLY